MKYNKSWGKIDTIRDRTTEQDSKLSAHRDTKKLGIHKTSGQFILIYSLEVKEIFAVVK